MSPLFPHKISSSPASSPARNLGISQSGDHSTIGCSAAMCSLEKVELVVLCDSQSPSPSTLTTNTGIFLADLCGLGLTLPTTIGQSTATTFSFLVRKGSRDELRNTVILIMYSTCKDPIVRVGNPVAPFRVSSISGTGILTYNGIEVSW